MSKDTGNNLKREDLQDGDVIQVKIYGVATLLQCQTYWQKIVFNRFGNGGSLEMADEDLATATLVSRNGQNVLVAENARLIKAIQKRDDLLNSVNEEANRYRAALERIAMATVNEDDFLYGRFVGLIDTAQDALKGGG